jgi:hypothetical protein
LEFLLLQLLLHQVLLGAAALLLVVAVCAAWRCTRMVCWQQQAVNMAQR